MAEIEITERQQHCLNRIRAADSRKRTPVEHINIHGLKFKDLCQWTDNVFIDRP